MKYEGLLLKGVKLGVILILFTPLILGPFGLTLSAYPKTVFFRSLVEFVLILYLLLVFVNRQYLPKITPLVLAVFIFIGTLFITSITGINFYRSFFGDPKRAEGVILHFHFFAFFLIVISVFNTKENWLKLFKISVIVSALSAFAGVLQRLELVNLYGISSGYRASGTLSNPDFFGPYMVLTVFLAVFILILEKTLKWKVLWFSIIALNCLALFLSGTRGAWIGMAAGIVFLFPFWLSYYFNLSRKRRIFIISIILFLSILLVLTSLSPEQFNLKESNMLRRFVSIFSFSLDSREDVWRMAFNAWKERPVLGWGPESFSFIYDKYFRADNLLHIKETIYFDYSHNKIMDLMSGSGLLGLLSYLSIFFIVFYLFFKQIIFNRTVCLVLTGFFVAYFVQTLFCFDTVSTYLIFFLILGFVNNNFSTSYKEIKLPRALRIISIVFIPLILISFYQINLKPTLASSIFPFFVGYEKENPKKAILRYKEAIDKNTIYSKDFRLITIERALLTINQSSAKKQKEEIIAILAELRPFLKQDLKKPDRRRNDSYKYLALIDQEIYFISKDPAYLESMEQTLKQAIEFNNERPEFHRLMGGLRILQNDYKEGEKFFQKVYEIYPDDFYYKTKFHRELGAAYLKAGNKLKAAENFKKALDIEYYSKKFNSQTVIGLSENNAVSFTEKVAIIYCRDLNDTETCVQIYKRAIEIYPKYENILRSHLEILMKNDNSF